ncbi:MAG: Galactoside O-acetyltransferase [Candidatus Ordinivivax streblomastigis]|uniref:Galactoside O-acetyltransferase n=1 Tax=Candidatus Ordinivivax streblomastigis TaxID=2540710 RepID=A0A5M8P5G3_9BACT|nr:MAG: Galactoside O-acetyltransferase [Candidatus Ordinivivax streblomastigis]
MKSILIKIIASCARMLCGEVSTDFLIKKGLKVGANFSREGGVRIDTSYCFLIEIGNNVTLAPNVILLAHDASLKMICGLSKLGRITIGDNVFIGANSVILPNVSIGSNVIIGAGSVVVKNVPDNSVYAGNPARYVRSISEIKNKNMELLKTRPTYDRTFSPLEINEKLKLKMKEELKTGFGFYQCNNYRSFNNQ